MNADGQADATCNVCGKGLTQDQQVTHLYHKGRRFTLCCPLCIDMFQRAPDRFASGERPQSVLDDLMSEIQWRSRQP